MSQHLELLKKLGIDDHVISSYANDDDVNMQTFDSFCFLNNEVGLVVSQSMGSLGIVMPETNE